MDDQLKQRVLAAIVGFNFTLIICMIALWSMYGSPMFWGGFTELRGLVLQLLISIVLGGIVAGGTYVFMQMSQK